MSHEEGRGLYEGEGNGKVGVIGGGTICEGEGTNTLLYCHIQINGGMGLGDEWGWRGNLGLGSLQGLLTTGLLGTKGLGGLFGAGKGLDASLSCTGQVGTVRFTKDMTNGTQGGLLPLGKGDLVLLSTWMLISSTLTIGGDSDALGGAGDTDSLRGGQTTILVTIGIGQVLGLCIEFIQATTSQEARLVTNEFPNEFTGHDVDETEEGRGGKRR